MSSLGGSPRTQRGLPGNRVVPRCVSQNPERVTREPSRHLHGDPSDRVSGSRMQEVPPPARPHGHDLRVERSRPHPTAQQSKRVSTGRKGREGLSTDGGVQVGSSGVGRRTPIRSWEGCVSERTSLPTGQVRHHRRSFVEVCRVCGSPLSNLPHSHPSPATLDACHQRRSFPTPTTRSSGIRF